MNIVSVLVVCLAAFQSASTGTLRIVDGDEVTKNSIPYQAHLLLATDFAHYWNCTGVLISENYVLTTSKCQWSGATRVTVLLGAHNIRDNETSQQSFYTKRSWKIYHSNFTYDTLENNIALVKLPTPATLNDNVQLAKLPTADTVTVGQTGTLSGWGVNRADLETVLQSASATVVDTTVCATSYPNFYGGDKVFCVQGDNGASGCNGDGGAPLVIDGVVVGIFSAGPIYVTDSLASNCTNKPNYFTKVASYLDWIKNNSDI